ncbi:hypothetical protein AACH06_25785 [Ideonella sp. DXS29W]|uniref:Lipoprotein n=1 Tax=Ideonella lacteola TaxID=2984193 RepID=A0ABU9BWA6_9BURK
MSAACGLAACGNKTDANAKNFSAALDAYFAKEGELCLPTVTWPVDVFETDVREKATPFGKTGKASQMEALEKAGLVKAEDVEVPLKGMAGQPGGRTFKARRFTLSDSAKPFVREREVEVFQLTGRTKEKRTDVCWGKQAVDKVVKWEGPMKFGDYQEAAVIYTYRIDGTADWAKQAEVQEAFPTVRQYLEDAGSRELKHPVKLTSEGWERKTL